MTDTNLDYVKIRMRFQSIQLKIKPQNLDAFIDVLFGFYNSSLRTQLHHNRGFELKFIEYIDLHSNQYLHVLAGKFNRKIIHKYKDSKESLVLSWQPGALKRVGVMNKETACLTTMAKSLKNCQFQPGDEHTDKSKKAISDKLTGKAKTEDHKQNISLARIGTTDSDEAKKNKSEAAKARWVRVREEKEAEEMRKNQKHTEETKAKISEGNKGKVMSEEARAKISESKTGVPQNNEHVAKRAQALTGRVLSEETKQKQRESALAIHAHKRAMKEAA